MCLYCTVRSRSRSVDWILAWPLLRSRSRSRKIAQIIMAPIDHNMTLYWSALVTCLWGQQLLAIKCWLLRPLVCPCKHSFILYHFLVIWRSKYGDLEIYGHSTSLKIVPFESLGTVSYSPYIATMDVSLAVSKILSVKQWDDLEIWVRSHSRSLEMAPFDRTHTSSYSSSIVTMAVIYVVAYSN